MEEENKEKEFEKKVVIEGRTYLEINENRREKFWMILKTIFLIVLSILVVVLIFAIYNIIEHKDMLTHEPLSYVMSRYNLESCSCVDFEGTTWNSGDKGFNPKYNGNDIRITYNDTKKEDVIKSNLSEILGGVGK